jgi:hypothetical protein
VQRGSISTRLIVGAVLVLAAAAVANDLRPAASSAPVAPPSAHVRTQEVQHPGGRQAIQRIGAAWARRLAANGLGGCFRTGAELCGRLNCARDGGYRLANCKPPTSAYRQSFRAARVDGVVIEQYEALAMLSNGERIRLEADGGTWWVVALGRRVGRGFFEKPG